MQILTSKDPAAANSLMDCLAPGINAATVLAKAVMFVGIAKRRNMQVYRFRVRRHSPYMTVPTLTSAPAEFTNTNNSALPYNRDKSLLYPL